MVGFGNSAWMYYIQKLNNDQYPSNRKHLSIKFGFKCSKQPMGSLHCGITCTSTLGYVEPIELIMKM
jgi:hypothetical protein